MNLKQYEKSWEDGLKAHKADPANAEYCWALCKIASLMENDLSIAWLEKAIDRGFRDFEQLGKWAPLNETLKSLKAQILITPQISAIYKAGVFKDDIILTNNSKFILDDFRGFVEVNYLKKSKNISFELAAAKTIFAKGAKIEFKNKFSMSKVSKCTITITFTSKQNPEKIRTVIHYNAKGKQKHLFDWQLEAEEAWQIIVTSNDKTKLEEAIEKLKGVAQKSKLESSHIISGIAHALHKLGNKEEAVKMQQKAIKILKKHVPGKIYDLTVIPYKRALEKFKELTKGK